MHHQKLISRYFSYKHTLTSLKQRCLCCLCSFHCVCRLKTNIWSNADIYTTRMFFNAHTLSGYHCVSVHKIQPTARTKWFPLPYFTIPYLTWSDFTLPWGTESLVYGMNKDLWWPFKHWHVIYKGSQVQALWSGRIGALIKCPANFRKNVVLYSINSNRNTSSKNKIITEWLWAISILCNL